MRFVTFAAAATLAVAGCQTAAERETADAEMERLVAARQGAEVDRICFTNNINGWNALGRNAVLLEKGVNDWYKVELTGTCDPQWAFESIALVSRPGGASCLTRNDRLITDDVSVPGVCYVDRIFEWDETKDPAPAPASAAPG